MVLCVFTCYKGTFNTMTQKESVMAAMDKTDQPAHSVDYYYLEAMKYLTCKEHQDDDSDCGCRLCRGEHNQDHDSNHEDDNQNSGGRERSWSHSMAENYDHDKLSKLPDITKTGSRLKNRRFSDGMLLKSNMKVNQGGHVVWADECKKELTRSRPRKKYERKPSVSLTPRKSILKHSSEESLPNHDDYEYDSDSN